MNLKQKIKNFPKSYQLILDILESVGYFDRRFWRQYPAYKITDFWRKRTDLVKLSPDNKKFKFNADGGKIFEKYQMMHNGLKIRLGSYYDYGNTTLLNETGGIHEPQEEFAFQEVLKSMPEDATMMELGSFWAFYSMWFATTIKNASCIMVEPDPHKMNFGKLNFKLNDIKEGHFELGFITDKTELKKSIPDYSVDFLIEKYKIDFLHLLHSDIQGYEVKMLDGAEQALAKKRIGFVFISTHSNELHYECINRLTSKDYSIICSADLDETYSWDGLIVAQANGYLSKSNIQISNRKNEN